MGGSEVENTSTPYKIIDYLNKLGGYAISLGMTSKEYWEDDPSYINTFIEAEKVKQAKTNQQLWLQGLYIYHAIGCLVPVLNPFSKEHKARPYMSNPISLTEEERQQELERKMEKYLNSLVGLKPKEEGGQ